MIQAHLMLIFSSVMKRFLFDSHENTILDAAIIAGLFAVFLLIAVPLMRGAMLRQHTAECARKIIQAADAFDFYAASFGTYPQGQRDAQAVETLMRGVFAAYEIDWWAAATELGGTWEWYNDKDSSSVVIVGTGVPEQQMVRLDQLIDDGNLETGAFQRRCSRYHYIIRDHVL